MLRYLRKILRGVEKGFNWLIDGNAKQSPLSGKFVSTTREFFQILVLRTVSALHALIYVVLFQGLNIAAQFVTGVFADAWNSDRKHIRNFVGIAISLISGGLSLIAHYISVVCKFIISLLKS